MSGGGGGDVCLREVVRKVRKGKTRKERSEEWERGKGEENEKGVGEEVHV